MTADKSFKRLVRARARRTGESYATARQRLLAKRTEDDTMTGFDLRPSDLSDWGFKMSWPSSWQRVAPDTSRWEVLRVIAPPSARPFLTVNKWGLPPGTDDLDEYERLSLESLKHPQGGNATDLRSSRTTISDFDAIRADYQGKHPMTVDTILSLRSYGLTRAPIGWVFTFATDNLPRDTPIFDAIAATIEVT
jgi:hypothetical protein